MRREILILLLFATIFGFLMILALGSVFYYNSIFEDSPCFQKIAKNFCKEKGMEFWKIEWDIYPNFQCKEYRSFDIERFMFTDNEIKRCLK